MTAAGLAAVSPVLVVGALLCLMPAVTRPTLQFGVRVPHDGRGRRLSAGNGAPTTGGPRPSASAALSSR